MARDQLIQIIKIVENRCGPNRLSSDFVEGIKSLFTVAINISGYQLFAHVVYFLGEDTFAISEIGCAQLPKSLSRMHDALDAIRLVLRVKVRFPNSWFLMFCVNLWFLVPFNISGTLTPVKEDYRNAAQGYMIAVIT